MTAILNVVVDTIVLLAGCPQKGIAALDWRRKHGLPERMSNEQPIKWQAQDEMVYRAAVLCGYTEHVDSGGLGSSILAVETVNSANTSRSWPERRHSSVNYRTHHGFGWRAALDPIVVAAACEKVPSPEAIVSLLASIAEASFEDGRCLMHTDCRMSEELGTTCFKTRARGLGQSPMVGTE